jgi:septal ring factor EnvC (AmiA/AmiB activator)
MRFEDLTNPQLKKVIRTYRLHLLEGITGYSSFDRDKLIKICQTFFNIDDEKIKPKVIEPIFFDIPQKPVPKKRARKAKEVKADNYEKLQRNINEGERKKQEQEKRIREKEEEIKRETEEIRRIKTKKNTEKKEEIGRIETKKNTEKKLTPENIRRVKALIRTYNKLTEKIKRARRSGIISRESERDSERLDEVEEKLIEFLKAEDNDWETKATEMGLMSG